MRDFLMGVRTGIGEDAIAWFLEPEVPGDLANRAKKSGDLIGGGSSGEIGQRDVAGLGNHQDVQRGLRVDVMEGEGEFILVDPLAGDFAAQNAGEDVVIVVGRQAGDGNG